MADQKSLLTPERLAEPDVYRPLSGLAVAAFFIAVGYALLMGVFAVVALTTGNPLFLALWTLLFPIVGAALAYAGRYQIQRSEGIRSGMALTNWAWWLCILFGVGYVAYYVGTFVAVSGQAKDFTHRWFQKLRDSKDNPAKLNEAFLDGIEPARRKYDRPNDADYMYQRYGISVGRRKGPLITFQEMDLVRVIQEAGVDAEVTSLGVKGWDYDKGGFQVTQTYRITTPEGVFVFDIAAHGSESKEIEGRQWQ